MSRVNEFAIESVFVGASTVLAGAVLNRAGLTSGRPAFWFTLGVVTHLGWELVGGNRWYVETRRPEIMPKGFMVKT